MRLYVDLDLRQITAGLGINSPMPALYFKRGDSEDLVIQFTRAGVVVDPDPDTVFFCVKAAGTYDGDALVLHTDFTKSGTGATAAWTGTPDFGGEDLNTLLGVGGGTDVDSVTLSAEVGFNLGGRDTTARTIRCIVENDLYRGTETAPPAYPRSGNVNLYPTITGLTGGGATKLDGLPTVGVTVGVVAQVVVSGVLQSFQLQAGTTAEDGSVVIRPDDYATTANEKIWVRVMGSAALRNVGQASGDVLAVGAYGEIALSGQYGSIGTSGDDAGIFTAGTNATVLTTGANGHIATFGSGARIFTTGANAHIRTEGGGYVQTSSTFKLYDGARTTTLSHAPTANRAQAFIDATGDIPVKVAVPATATSTGVAGSVAFDSTHAYFCTAANTWRRVAISTW